MSVGSNFLKSKNFLSLDKTLSGAGKMSGTAVQGIGGTMGDSGSAAPVDGNPASASTESFSQLNFFSGSGSLSSPSSNNLLAASDTDDTSEVSSNTDAAVDGGLSDSAAGVGSTTANDATAASSMTNGLSDGASAQSSSMDPKTAALTMAAYIHQDKTGDLSTADIADLQSNPAVSAQVRAAATYFTQNQTAADDVDGAKNGKLDGKMSSKDFEAFVNNGATVDQGQSAAMELGAFLKDPANKAYGGKLTAQSLQSIVSDPNATAAQQSSATYLLQNQSAFNEADGANAKGKNDGVISAKDLSTAAYAQVDSAPKAAAILRKYLDRNNGFNFGKMFEQIGMGLAMAALAVVPGVGEVADGAIAGADAGMLAADGAAEAGAAGSEAAAEGAASGTASALGKQAVKQGVDNVKDQVKDNVKSAVENAVTPQQQGPVLDGDQNAAHTVNIAGMQELLNKPGTPLDVKAAVSFLLNNPSALSELQNEQSKNVDGQFNSKDTRLLRDNANKQISTEESQIQVNA